MGAPVKFPVYTVPTASGGIARLVCARCLAAGVPLQPLLAKVGLSLEDIEDRSSRIEVGAQIKLLEIAAEALQDDLLGFHLSQDFELREVGLIYYVISSSGTFSEAMSNSERYTRIVNEGIGIKFDAGRTVIALDCVDTPLESDRHHMEFWLFSMVRLCRDLTDTRIAPKEVKTRHHREPPPPEFRKFLGCDVIFGADANEIVLPRSVKTLPVVGADRFLNELLVGYAEQALTDRTTLRFRTEQVIARLLPHGHAKAPEVARELGMSTRSLARSLAAEGVSFSEVLDRHRADLANYYLKNGDFSISQIAWLSGYGDVNSFGDAFNRWFGISPTELRARSHAKAGRVDGDRPTGPG